MSDEAEARAVKVAIPNDRRYSVELSGQQLKFLLALLNSNQYPGNQVFLVAATMDALQEPILNEAHGAESDGE